MHHRIDQSRFLQIQASKTCTFPLTKISGEPSLLALPFSTSSSHATSGRAKDGFLPKEMFKNPIQDTQPYTNEDGIIHALPTELSRNGVLRVLGAFTLTTYSTFSSFHGCRLSNKNTPLTYVTVIAWVSSPGTLHTRPTAPTFSF